MELTRRRQQSVPRASRTSSTNDLPSRKKDVQQMVNDKLSTFLTVYEDIHFLDETVDNFEYLCSGYPSLIFCESVQPL